ncbi:MAG: DegQ family serine endoprotease [Gammaproteobacteria bacterium]|nr:DegQ family serine endoprotease [Gammaproteobacteria bacterium]NNF60973.1 DegQ family serine endoprotease [Gammaproteobacteria bacterium]NNM21261.1 DegQ family serine endoprotease [Gammaproteobacteria bacterium]
MKTRLAIAAVLLLTSAWSLHAALPLEVGGKQVPSLAPMIKEVAPSVVNIAVRGSVEVANNPFFDDPFFRRFFDVPEQSRRRQFQSAGSGVIVDASKGYILTNAHVVNNAEEIEVTLLDDRTVEAKVIGADAGSDIAVIQVESGELKQIALGNSDELEVGDFVVAIGNPFGFTNTVTSGIVSALGRSGLNRDAYEDFIQTDAPINPGNSGGALIDLNGELVGINSAIISNSGGNLGIGFAIPINMARSIMDQIVEFGEVRRGLLGVNIYTLTDELAEAYGLDTTEGALVAQVMPGSAAEKAGIEAGDVIVDIDGTTVDDAGELRNTIGLMRIGDEVKVTVIRDGKRRRLTAELGGAQDQQIAAAELPAGLRGAELSELPDNREYRGVEGVLVASVEAGSAAARRGLQAGDVITKVNRSRIDSLAGFREAIEEAQSLVLTIRRGSAQLLLIL